MLWLVSRNNLGKSSIVNDDSDKQPEFGIIGCSLNILLFAVRHRRQIKTPKVHEIVRLTYKQTHFAMSAFPLKTRIISEQC